MAARVGSVCAFAYLRASRVEHSPAMAKHRREGEEGKRGKRKDKSSKGKSKDKEVLLPPPPPPPEADNWNGSYEEEPRQDHHHQHGDHHGQQYERREYSHASVDPETCQYLLTTIDLLKDENISLEEKQGAASGVCYALTCTTGAPRASSIYSCSHF